MIDESRQKEIDFENIERDLLIDPETQLVTYIGFFDAVKRPVAYNHIPPEAQKLIEDIEASGGSEASETYHRLVLLTLIQQFEKRATAIGLPEKLHGRAIDFLAKLVRRLQKPKAGQYRFDRDGFLKDLGVTRLKLWPCGAEFVR